MALNGKVMVTGGAAIIGSHAVLALCDAGYDVVVVDNLAHRLRLGGRSPAQRWSEANVADDIAVRAAIRDTMSARIMHFAGSCVVPESVHDPQIFKTHTPPRRDR